VVHAAFPVGRGPDILAERIGHFTGGPVKLR
jgi:hypothetical protein